MAKRTAARGKKTPVVRSHRHEPGRCLNILRKLSAYIDDELSQDICRQIRTHLGACPHCEEFMASLRQTVLLCRHRPTPALSSADRLRMREAILQNAGRL
jgi:anti-sigma factor RsiW